MYKMMIVEDELFVRIGLERAVNWEDRQIKLLPSASNGREALELYEKYHPHLILTDIKMQEMNGVELISTIRKKDKNVKFIVISCLEDYQIVKQVLNFSVSRYYNKNELNIEQLVESISVIINELSETSFLVEQRECVRDPFDKNQEEWNRFLFEGKSCDLERLLSTYQGQNKTYTLIRLEFGDIRKADFGFVQSVLKVIVEKQSTGYCLAISQKQAVFLYVLDNISQDQSIEQLNSYLCHLKTSMQSYFNITISVIASSIFYNLQEFSQHWEEIQHRADGSDAALLLEQQISPQKVFSAIQYVREHLAENLTLPVVAKYVNFSAGYLSSLFKQELDVSFSEFVLNARVRKVKFLLTQGDDTLHSIAEQTGFHDASYLIKVFKRTTGQTPNEYRQNDDSARRHER